MDVFDRIKKYALMGSLTILISFSISVAFVTYRYYGVVARGVTGLVLLYLSYSFGRYSKMEVSIDDILMDPRKGKYLISAFVVPLITYWAFMQIYEMILFFWKR